MSIDYRQFIDDLARTADLLLLAEKCGLDVVRDSSRKPRTRCPFHDDHRPSLQVYPKVGSSDREQFHCFVCGAHGDVFDLVKELRKLDFWEAVQWVAAECGITVPRSKGRGTRATLPPRRTGLQEAANIYSHLDQGEREMLADFATHRGFQSQFLMDSEVFAARGNKVVGKAAGNRLLLEALQEAGVVRQPEPIRQHGDSLHLPIARPPHDLYSTDRIVFTIRSREGETVGFTGRAIGAESPKYLFTKQFPKGETLYRLDRVLKTIREHEPPQRLKKTDSGTFASPILHLFVVEGLLDALRLEVLGLHAVAVLGSQLTNGQAKLISELADETDRRELQLAVHLFLDADNAGRNGMVAALPRLLNLGAVGTSFGVDVIIPSPEACEAGHDPDDLFRDVSSLSAAMAKLQPWCHPPLDFMLADGLGSAVTQLKDDWPRTEVSLRMRAMRFVERQLDKSLWPRVLDRVAPFEPWLNQQSTAGLSAWQDELSRFLRATSISDNTGRVSDRDLQFVPRLERTDEGRLLHALQLAQASTQRRELPVDESSWTRLKRAWDIVAPSFEEQLSSGSAAPEPMVAVLVPRGDGDFRLKALPSPEDLILQQYLLYELLREVPSSRFLEMIPAVRYQSGLRSDSLRTTGPDHLVPEGGQTVSFAYQIDMDVLEGRIPPRREGMFRPYFNCWTDFIAFIDRHVGQAIQSEFHVARLDIRRFYDSLPRHAVHDTLFPALRSALALIPQGNGTDTLSCARLFRPHLKDPDDRARALVDWLCEQSFGYQYLDPKTGEVNSRQPLERGVPQGPDLSAYLANISLFPLDHDLSREALAIDGVYSRYVDDMVIISPTASGLGRLRALIEDNLSRLGLELSSKTEPLPPMRRDEVREWLTDSRGGLGVSGPFAGPPINEPLITLEPLADAGDLDRTSALTLLHDARMTDPDTPLNFVLRAVKTARLAANLRFSELIKAARILWSRVLDIDEDAGMRSLNTEPTPYAVAESFKKRWKETGSEESRIEAGNLTVAIYGCQLVCRLIAWLDGLESFMSRRDDRSPELSATSQERIANRRIELAHQVHIGLCSNLQDLVRREDGGQDAVAQHQHMIDLKILSIHFAAGIIVTPTSSYSVHLPQLEDPSPAQSRFLYSLAEQCADVALIRQLKVSGEKHPFPQRLLLHEAIVRLATKPPQHSKSVDPLERMRQPILDQFESWSISGPIPMLLRVLNLWLPSSEMDTSDAPLALAAASALAHIGYAPSDLLMRRPKLAEALLADQDQVGLPTNLISSPPGINIPGIIGVQYQQSLPDTLVRLDFNQSLTCSPSTLEWTRVSPLTASHPRFHAILDDRKLLTPLKRGMIVSDTGQSIVRDQYPLWLALAFEGLVEFCRRESDTEECPPTAYNLLGPALGTPSSTGDRWELLSHKVPRENLIGQAFVRSGARGLIAMKISEHHAELWRIGTALADWLDMLDGSCRHVAFRAVDPIDEQAPHHDWALDTLMRVALNRLRGISLPASALPVNDESQLKLPKTITRILDCLKAFPSAQIPSSRWQRTAMLLAHLGESRALVTRYDSRHRVTDLSAPGAAVAMFVEISRHQLRADETLADELPRVTTHLEQIPKRRPVRAWCMLAARVQSLAEQIDVVTHECATMLYPLISGSRLMALTLQLRMQTLEHWSEISATQREAFVTSPPELTSWDLDETALLHLDQNERRLEPSIAEGAFSKARFEASNIQILFLKLTDATTDGAANTWETLARITPLGWCVALGSMLGFLRTSTQKTIVSASGRSLRKKTTESFAKLQWASLSKHKRVTTSRGTIYAQCFPTGRRTRSNPRLPSFPDSTRPVVVA